MSFVELGKNWISCNLDQCIMEGFRKFSNTLLDPHFPITYSALQNIVQKFIFNNPSQ